MNEKLISSKDINPFDFQLTEKDKKQKKATILPNSSPYIERSHGESMAKTAKNLEESQKNSTRSRNDGLESTTKLVDKIETWLY